MEIKIIFADLGSYNCVNIRKITGIIPLVEKIDIEMSGHEGVKTAGRKENYFIDKYGKDNDINMNIIVLTEAKFIINDCY